MKRFATLFCSLILYSSLSQAAVVINVNENDGDVVATATGSLNLAGLSTSVTTSHNRGQFAGTDVAANYNHIIVGPGPGSGLDIWKGDISVPSIFASVSNYSSSDGGSVPLGAVIDADGTGLLYVPTGYVFGNPIDGTSTWNGQSFASLGLSVGTYIWTWSTDSITLEIGGMEDSIFEDSFEE